MADQLNRMPGAWTLAVQVGAYSTLFNTQMSQISAKGAEASVSWCVCQLCDVVGACVTGRQHLLRSLLCAVLSLQEHPAS
jgi:hypothetical protein